MSGRIIQDFKLATSPTKLWECMRLAGLRLQSPAGVRKENSERHGHRRPYCRRRGRSGFIVLLLVLLALSVTGEPEGSQDGRVKMPPPPGRSMRQQLSEQDRSIHRDTDDDNIELFEKLLRGYRESAKRLREEAKKLEEAGDELERVLKQKLQGCVNQDQPEEGVSPGEAQGPDTTHKLKLKFNGSLSKTIYTKDSLLKYSNGGPIEIAVYRGDQIIISGDFSKLEVEIVALEHSHTCKGDWTEEDFDRQIIRSGQGPNRVSVLGKSIVQLDHGKASLDNIHFKEGSGGKHFILAARVVRSRNIIETTRVEKAFMDDYPFLVLTDRSKANKKIALPKLNDKVHGLKGIKKDGFYDKRLKEAGINTLQEFLKAFNEAPEMLRCQILKINTENNRFWRDMVQHARECDVRNDHKLKSCTLQVQKTEITLFFNVVHDLVGAKLSGSYVAKGKFTESQKVAVDDLLKLAYQELTDTFDHIMIDNYPVSIHASINAASQRNTHYHQAAFLAAENLGSASGIDCADGPLPGTTEQSAPEPSRSVHRNEIANQDQNHTPEGDHDDDANAFSVRDVPVAEIVNGTDARVYIHDFDQQVNFGPKVGHLNKAIGQNRTPREGSLAERLDELFASVKESDKNNPALYPSSAGNFELSTNATFGQDQAGNSASASGNDRALGGILGDANRNVARYMASTPYHEATSQSQAAAPGPQSQPSNALGFASNPFVEYLQGQGTTFAAFGQSQPSTVPGFASIRNPFEEPPVQGTTFAALGQSQSNMSARFASSSNPFEDPSGQDPLFDYNATPSYQYPLIHGSIDFALD